MTKNYLRIIVITLLGLLPFGVVWIYVRDNLPYENSPHINTLWNKGEPMLELNHGVALNQSFKVMKDNLKRIDVKFRRGEGKYGWSIKKDLRDLNILYGGSFNGSDVQNYDFLSFILEDGITGMIGETLWLSIYRFPLKNIENSENKNIFAKNDNQNSIAVFSTKNDYKDGELLINGLPHENDIVFQLYYSK